ncbi:preprotein translocase subunit SecG [Pirellulaceae bacterium]|jgi:preprotein translocase subunit SecG|nr:preprotein translocase subunit SecG [Pirellulaceae bacterium]
MFEFLLIADSSGFFLGLLGVILFLLSLFLVFIILIQRGKGGGIAGSLTGTAQSAFGARGGDILMWLTLTMTIIWILLCCLTIFFYSRTQPPVAEGSDDADIQTATDSPTGLNSEFEGTLPNNLVPPVNPTNETGTNTSPDDASTEKAPNTEEPMSDDASTDVPIDDAASGDDPMVDDASTADPKDDNAVDDPSNKDASADNPTNEDAAPADKE